MYILLIIVVPKMKGGERERKRAKDKKWNGNKQWRNVKEK